MSEMNLDPDEEFNIEMQMDAAYLGEWFSRLDEPEK